MKTGQHKPVGELRMSNNEFDRIMRRALQVHPEAPKTKKPTKMKAAGRKVRATK